VQWGILACPALSTVRPWSEQAVKGGDLRRPGPAKAHVPTSHPAAPLRGGSPGALGTRVTPSMSAARALRCHPGRVAAAFRRDVHSRRHMMSFVGTSGWFTWRVTAWSPGGRRWGCPLRWRGGCRAAGRVVWRVFGGRPDGSRGEPRPPHLPIHPYMWVVSRAGPVAHPVTHPYVWALDWSGVVRLVWWTIRTSRGNGPVVGVGRDSWLAWWTIRTSLADRLARRRPPGPPATGRPPALGATRPVLSRGGRADSATRARAAARRGPAPPAGPAR
jgi:hypothetical protein